MMESERDRLEKIQVGRQGEGNEEAARGGGGVGIRRRKGKRNTTR